ncbi:hypothetical protein B0H14DRAFT_2565293 [Mycena olivaceomarginata]|nr:hypothetical protein B0H14DRAFT_2565293 [Mycena olivaceomarginata]
MFSPAVSSNPLPEPQATEEEVYFHHLPATTQFSHLPFQIEEELCTLDLEDADSLLEHVQDLISQHLDEFPDDGVDDEVARYAAKMAKASITDGTRTGHLRIIKHYFVFHLRRNKKWDAKRVDEQTPRDIAAFITLKCGPTEQGFEGRKYSTAVSTRAALTMWYRSLRPNESTAEWRLDPATNTWRGLPTRSRHVSQFMVGLEKTKAKSGEVSSSARALSLDDIHRLHNHCLDPSLTPARKRAGIVRYVAYLLAWLMMLRIDEVVHLTFENIDKIVGERRFIDVGLNTRKQNQTGLLHSWRLHANDNDPLICPVRAFILLASLYGPHIKKIRPTLSAHCQCPGPLPFERLAGARYRIKVKKWSAGEVAAWGGWSQVEAVTMFWYFYSPNDNHEFMQDYDKNY